MADSEGFERRPKLTSDASVRNIRRPGLYADEGRSGLYLVVQPGGAKSWLLRYQHRGRRREMGLGTLPTYSLAEARNRVAEARKLIDQGIDPIDQRRRDRAAAKAAEIPPLTFRECAIACHKALIPTWKNPKHADQWINTLATYAFPELGELLPATITKAHVLRVLEPIWTDKTETASRLRQRVRHVLDWCEAQGYRAHDPRLWPDVAQILPKAGKLIRQKRAHFAAAAPGDVHGILAAVRASGAEDAVKDLFEFVVLTAARSGEARGARWSEIDLHHAAWKIPASRMKAGKEHRIPLSPRAVAILEAARARTRGLDLVFPTRKRGQYSDMALTELLRRLEIAVTMHGFRSTFRDWAGEMTAFGPDVIEAALAHGKDVVVAAYQRGDLFEKRRELMSAWAKFVATKPRKPADNVVTLARRG